jgi:hypothetical protein
MYFFVPFLHFEAHKCCTNMLFYNFCTYSIEISWYCNLWWWGSIWLLFMPHHDASFQPINNMQATMLHKQLCACIHAICVDQHCVYTHLHSPFTSLLQIMVFLALEIDCNVQLDKIHCAFWLEAHNMNDMCSLWLFRLTKVTQLMMCQIEYIVKLD